MAGADIKEMADKPAADFFMEDFFSGWTSHVAATRKPWLAAVAGFALGGGCELALACDIVIAGESARFGVPEVKLGAIPGAGGTQRLVHAVGKAKAMEMCLTGRFMDAAEAEAAGLVSRVVPAKDLAREARETAAKIAEAQIRFTTSSKRGTAPPVRGSCTSLTMNRIATTHKTIAGRKLARPARSEMPLAATPPSCSSRAWWKVLHPLPASGVVARGWMAARWTVPRISSNPAWMTPLKLGEQVPVIAPPGGVRPGTP